MLSITVISLVFFLFKCIGMVKNEIKYQKMSDSVRPHRGAEITSDIQDKGMIPLYV